MDYSFEEIARWLPRSVDPQTIANWIGNKSLYPHLLPETELELLLEQGAIREKLRQEQEGGVKSLEKSAPETDWEEVFTQIRKFCRSDTEAIGIILDGLEPREIVTIGDLATLVCPVGVAVGSKIVGQLIVDLGLTEKQKIIAPPDDILLLPIPKGQKIKLKIKLTGGLRLLRKTDLDLEIDGVNAGIIIDFRGRPFPLPSADNPGRERIKKWREALG